MQGPVLSSLYALTLLTPTQTLWSRYCYSPQFKDEETEPYGIKQMSKDFIIISQFTVLICFPICHSSGTMNRQEPGFIHLLCLKMVCPSNYLLYEEMLPFNMLIYIGEFISYGPIMGCAPQMFIPGWFKNWVISQWWMAHSFRRSTWPAGHFSGICRCCSRILLLTQHLLCKLFPPGHCGLCIVIFQQLCSIVIHHVPSSDAFAPDCKTWDKSGVARLQFDLWKSFDSIT